MYPMMQGLGQGAGAGQRRSEIMTTDKEKQREDEPKRQLSQHAKKPYKPPRVVRFGDLQNLTHGGGCGCGGS